MTTKVKLSLYCLVLTAILASMMDSLSFVITGYAQRGRQISQSQNPANPKTEPPSTPAPRVTTGQSSTTKSQQPPAEGEEGTFRINSNLVAVPVSVTDASGQPVRDLTVTDFL